MHNTGLDLGVDQDDYIAELPYNARRTHMQILGVSQKGKSTFLEHIIRQDIRNGQGLCLIDPHGGEGETLTQNILRWMISHGYQESREVHILEPGHPEFSFGFNPLSAADNVSTSVQIEHVFSAIKQAFGEQDVERMPMLGMILQMVLYTLVVKNLTLLEAVDLTNPDDPDNIRAFLTEDIRDQYYEQPWGTLNDLSKRDKVEQLGMAFRRFFQLLKTPYLRYVLGQSEGINLRQCMDEGHIILVNLGRTGEIPESDRNFIGSLLVNALYTAALGRVAYHSQPFYLYMDESDRYLSETIPAILDQTAKFGLHLVMAHQRLGQLRNVSDNVYNAVMQGAQTKVVFGLNDEDDLKAIAGALFLDEFDLEHAKHGLDKWMATGEYRTVQLHSSSNGVTHSESQSHTESSAHGTSEGMSDGQGHSDTDFTMSPDGLTAVPIGSTSDSAATQSSESYMEGKSESHGQSEGSIETKGVHEAREAILEKQVTAYHSLEEERHMKMVLVKRLPKGVCVVKMPEKPSVVIQTPLPPSGFVSEERFQETVQELIERDSVFIKPIKVVEREISERKALLIEQASTEAQAEKLEPEPFGQKLDWIPGRDENN